MQDSRLQAAIRRYLAKTGMSERGLSTRARLNEKAVTQILKGRSQNPRIDTVEALAMVMGMAVSDLIEGGEPATPEPNELLNEPPRLPLRHEMPRDVPVFGTAMGANGDGAFTLNLTGQIDTARRGPGIMNSRGVFAIYVEGESMAPRFEPGELLYLDKNRPIRPGDDVVVVMDSPESGREPRSYLKRLVRRTADRWICQQFNPPGEVTFDVVAMKDKFRVLKLQEVMGL